MSHRSVDHRHAADGGRARFPRQRSLGEQSHWDAATKETVLARVGLPPDVCFFTSSEEGIAAALLDRLVGQDESEGEARLPLVNAVDARLAAGQTDGWRYADLAEDGEVWRRALAALDEDANERYGTGFAAATSAQQDAVLAAVQGQSGAWHGMPAAHVWNLLMRYACTAFYAFPRAWDEIGFPGPAYPRGYANLGLDRREHFEARDARARDTQAPGTQAPGTQGPERNGRAGS